MNSIAFFPRITLAIYGLSDSQVDFRVWFSEKNVWNFDNCCKPIDIFVSIEFFHNIDAATS